MPGILGPAVNVIAIAYVMIILFFSFWPPETPVQADNMNYCILVTGVVVSFSIIWYLVGGRRQYKGPVVQTTGTDQFGS